MKFLVTGASGFVGSHLRQAVEDKGDIFIAVPRSVYLDPLRLERFVRDIEPDYIIHLASYGNLYDQTEVVSMLETNLSATYNLMEVTKDIPYKAFINVSTSSVELQHPTFYSATKAGAEQLAMAFQCQFGKPIITMRPFSLYGENDHESHFIPTVFRHALSGKEMALAPEPVHDWVHVTDFVTAMIDACENIEAVKESGQCILRVGTGIPRTNQQVIHIIEEITGKKIKVSKQKRLRGYDAPDWYRREGAYHEPFIGLKEGLKQYYRWYTEEKK